MKGSCGEREANKVRDTKKIKKHTQTARKVSNGMHKYMGPNKYKEWKNGG